MAGNSVDYIIRLIPDDKLLQKKLSAGELLSKSEISKIKSVITSVVQEANREASSLGKTVGNNIKNGLDAGFNVDTKNLERTIDFISGIFKELEKTGNPMQDWAKTGKGVYDSFTQMQTSVGVLAQNVATLDGKIASLTSSFQNFEKSYQSFHPAQFASGAKEIDKIATAMAKIGIDKSAITNMKQVGSELKKLAKQFNITLDIDYSALSDTDLLNALRNKYGKHKLDLNELLQWDWDTQIGNLDAEGNELKKVLMNIVALESKIKSKTGKSPVDKYTFEDTRFESMKDITETLEDFKRQSKDTVKEVLDELDKGVSEIKKSITEQLGKMAAVEIDLTLDEDNKTQFKQKVDDFISNFNVGKYGKVKDVQIDLGINQTKSRVSKADIDKTKTQIANELKAIEEQKANVENILNNEENGLYAQQKQSKNKNEFAARIANAKTQIDKLEQQIISYKYLLNNMDSDSDFAKAATSDWKRLESTSQSIRISQDKLLNETRQWRNEMNDALRFTYSLDAENAESNFVKLVGQLEQIAEKYPVRLVPNIDYMIDALEQGLAEREINVKLTSNQPISGDFTVAPRMRVPSQRQSDMTPKDDIPTPPSNQGKPEDRVYIQTDIGKMIEFLQNVTGLSKFFDKASFEKLAQDYSNADNEGVATEIADKLKQLMIDSIIKSFKNYFDDRAKRIKEYDAAIPKLEQEKARALALYNSDEEVQKRQAKITAKEQEIAKITTNPVIQEYINLMEEMRTADDETYKILDEKKRKALPAVKQAYSEFIKLTNELEVLKKPDKNDVNLKNVNELDEKINATKTRRANLDRRYDAYKSFLPIDKIEKLIGSSEAKDAKALSDLIMTQILNKPGIVDSMGPGRKSVGTTDQIKLFDTQSQRLITETIAMVQDAINVSRVGDEERSLRLNREQLLSNVITLSTKRHSLNTLSNEIMIPSEDDFSSVLKLFKENVDNETKRLEAKRASNATITDDDKKYNTFYDAVKVFSQAADEWREIYNSFSATEKREFAQAEDKMAWLTQKVNDTNIGTQYFDKYTKYNVAQQNYKNSIASQEKDEKNNIPYKKGIATELTDQLRKYVFRVTLVDDNGNETYVGFGTKKYEKKGLQVTPGHKFNTESKYAYKYFTETLPSDLSDIENIEFYKAFGIKDDSVLSEPIYKPYVTKKDTSKDYTVSKAKSLINMSKLGTQDRTEVPTVEEELNDVYTLLEESNKHLELLLEDQPSDDDTNKVQQLSDKKLDAQKKLDSFLSYQKQDRIYHYDDVSDPIVDNIAQQIIDAENQADNLEKLIHQPLNKKLQDKVGVLPDSVVKLIDLTQRVQDLYYKMPESEEENAFIQQEIPRLNAEIVELRNEISESIQTQKNQVIESLKPQLQEARKALVPKYQEEIVSLVQQLNVLPNSIFEFIDLEQRRDVLLQKTPTSAQEEALIKQEISELNNQINAWKSDNKNLDRLYQFQELVSHIKDIIGKYNILLNQFGATTNGQFGNSTLKNAKDILSNPLSKDNWDKFDNLPIDALEQRRDLALKDQELEKMYWKDTSQTRRNAINRQRMNIAEKYNQVNSVVKEWFDNLQKELGEGIFKGLDVDGLKVLNNDTSNPMTAADIVNKYGHTSVNDVIARDVRNAQSELTTVSKQLTETEQETRQKTQEINDTQALIHILEERKALAERRKAIEEELLNDEITTERQAELQAELIENQNKSIEAGMKARKFRKQSIDENALKDAYMVEIEDTMKEIQISNERLSHLRDDAAKGTNKLQYLSHPIKKDGTMGYTAQEALMSYAAQKASTLDVDNPKLYQKLWKELEKKFPIDKYVNYQNPEEHQTRAIQYAMKDKATKYLFDNMSDQEQQAVIQAAIETQKQANKAIDERIKEEVRINNELTTQRKQYMEEGQITQEMLDARQQTTEEIRSEGKIVHEKVESAHQTEAPQQSSSKNDNYYTDYSGGYSDGNIYGIDTSKLAQQDTLAKIYELLSGNNVNTGLSDDKRKALEEEYNTIQNRLGSLGRDDETSSRQPISKQEALNVLTDMLDEGTSESKKQLENTKTETKEASESIMTIGKAVSIINKAIGSSTAKTATGMAKAYEAKIHSNNEAIEAAKLLYNTPDSEFTSRFGRNTKNKLKSFRDAWASKQENEVARSKALQELEEQQWNAKSKNDAYKKAVETVRDAIGGFKGRSDAKKAEKYNSLGQEVKDAGNIIYENLQNATKEEKLLFDKLKRLRDAATAVATKNASKTSNQADVLLKDSEIIKTTLPNGSPFEGTKQEYDEYISLLNSQDVNVEIDPIVKPNAVEDAINSEVRKHPPKISLIEAEFAIDENNIIPFEGNEEEFNEMVSQYGEPIRKNIIESNEQVENEKLKTEETQKQLDNTEQLRSRQAEIEKILENDDAIKANINSEQSTDGGLIGILRTLATQNTLNDVLNVLREISKKQYGMGKPSAAGDLWQQFKNMIDASVTDKHERVAYIDLATGNLSGSVIGGPASIDGTLLNSWRKKYPAKEGYTAQIHTHADSGQSYFSEKDLNRFKIDFQDGIKQQILLSKEHITMLDLSAVQSVEQVNALMDELVKAKGNLDLINAAIANVPGAIYGVEKSDDLNANTLVKMLGIKGVESKYSDAETREMSRAGVLDEAAKESAEMIQESTGRAIKTTVERVGLELETLTEKTDVKGNKTWTSKLGNKVEKSMLETYNDINAFEKSTFGQDTEAFNALNTYTTLYDNLIAKVKEFNSVGENKRPAIQQEINALLPQFKEAESAIIKLINKSQQFADGKDIIGTFNQSQISNAGDNLHNLAINRYVKNGENVAFNGLKGTQSGTQLLIDVLKDNVITQYALEVNKATGQVREFEVAQNALSNAFLDFNKVMRQNEVVQATIAVGNTPDEQESFMNSAHSAEWDTYKKSLKQLQDYVANVWAQIRQNIENGSGNTTATKSQLNHIKALSENVLALGENVRRTASDFKYMVAQAQDGDVENLNIKIKKRGDSRDAQVRAAMEQYAQKKADKNKHYDFVNFDNDTLTYKLTDIKGNVEQITLVWNELYKQILTVSDKSVSALDPLVKKVETFREKLEDATNAGYLLDDDKDLINFRNKIDEINKAIQDNKSFEYVQGLRKEAIVLYDIANKTATTNKRKMTGTNEVNAVKRQHTQFISGFNDDELRELRIGDGSQYFEAYDKLVQQAEAYKHQIADPKIQESLAKQAYQVQFLRKELTKAINEDAELQKNVDNSGFFTNKFGNTRKLGGVTTEGIDINNLKSSMLQYAQSMEIVNLEHVKMDNVNRRLTGDFRLNNKTVAEMVIQLNKAGDAMYMFSKGEKESLSGLPGFMKALKEKTKAISQYLFSMTSIYRVLGELKKGVQYVKEIDAALTELKKVTDETEETYDRFLNTAAKTADKIGSTIKEVVSSTADFARLGYTIQEATMMAESAQVLMNVSEFTDISTATDSLISSIQAFKYTAEESMDVVDILNTIGNNYAISTADLATSLTKSSGSLVAANGTLEEAVALTATANTIIQDSDVVGTALKTVAMRLRGTGVEEMEAEGIDADGAVVSKSKLRGKVKALSGVDILTDTGAYKSTYQILLEIAEVWEDIDDMEQAALLEILAGKRAGSVMSAILQNPETLKDAFESANEAAGSALEENEKYLDSIQGRIDLFTNATQTMWSNALDDDVIKFFVNIGTELVKLVDNFGLIKTLIVGIGSYLIKKHFKGDLFGGLFGNVPQTIDTIKSKLKELEQAKNDAASKLAQSPKSRVLGKKSDKATKAYNVYNDSVGPLINQYDTLNEKLKVAQANLDKYQTRLNNYQGSNQNTIKQYQHEVDKAKLEVNGLEAEIRAVEVQLNVTGNTGQTAFQKIKLGAKAAGKAVWKFGKEMAMSMAYAMAFTAILEALGNIGEGLAPLFENMDNSPEKLHEKFSEAENELSNVESELSNLESELDSVNERIEELSSQNTLSFIEQEELDRLRSENDELERAIKLNEQLKKAKQVSVNSTAISAADAYLQNTSFSNEQTKTEKQEEAKDIGSGIGQVAGTIIGGIVGTVIGGGITLASGGTAAVPGAAIGIAVGSTIVGWFGGEVGSGLAGASYDSEQSVAEEMDNMIAKREELKKAQDDAQDAEAYNEATEALATYDAQMAKHITQIQQYYNAMDWDTATDEEKQKMIEYADWLDKYAINMGVAGAKSNAIARIFGDEADEDLKNIKAKIESAAQAGEDFELKDILSDEEYNKVLTRLHSIGLGAGDVVSYFEQIRLDEINEVSTLNAVKEVANLTEGIKQLKNAFEELRDVGQVSAESIVEIAETFKGVDGIDKLVTMLSTGAYTVEQMTEQAAKVAEEYINGKINGGNITEDEYLTYVNALNGLGVQDADKYIQALLTRKAAEAIANGTSKEDAIDLYSIKNSDGEVIIPVELPDTIVNSAKDKKNADEKVDDLQEKKKEYDQAVTDKKNAQGNKDLYDSYIKYIESFGVFSTEYLTEAFDEDFDFSKLQFSSYEMPDIFRYSYDSAKAAYQDGNEEELKIHLENLKKYGVNIDNISTAFDNNIDASKIWTENTSMTPEILDALNKAKELYLNGLDIPEITVPTVTQADVDGAKDEAQKAAEKYQAELDKIGFVLDIKLVDTNELIDDLQNVYDTLTDAAQEYAENGGYVSVDTLQTLLGLDAKYIGLLYNEQGQLELNTESIQRMTQARIMDMAVLQAKSYLTDLENAAIADNVEQLAALTEATYIAEDSEWSFVDAKLAHIKTQMMANGIDEVAAQQYIDNARHNIMAMQKLAETTSKNISNTISSSGNNAKDLAKEAYDKEMKYWENRIAANQARYEQIQNEIDLLESQGKKAGPEYYEEQKKLEEERLWLLEQQKAAAQKYLGTFKEGSDEWWEVASQLNDIEGEIDDVTQSIQDLNDAIAEVNWYGITEPLDRLANERNTLDTVRELIAPNDEEDWFDDEGNWTEEGVAVAGTYVQQIEIDKQSLQETRDILAKLSKPYEGNEEYYKSLGLGIDSEQDLYDKRLEYQKKEQDALKGISDSQQAIVDMYEAQIDAVEEYVNELVEGYQEYIDLVKEALDAERELYEFKKDVEKQTKDIASLERRIASLSGSTNAADIAERRKLEAELAEAKEGLNDTYYDHAMDAQQDALDDEAVAYEESMNKYIEKLRETLESATDNMNDFMAAVISCVMINADTVSQKYDETGVSMSGYLTKPWEDAAKAVEDFQGNSLELMNSWITDEGFFGKFKTGATDALKSPWKAGTDAVTAFKNSAADQMSQVVKNVESNVIKAKEQLDALYKQILDTEKKAADANYGGGGGYTGGSGDVVTTLGTAERGANATVEHEIVVNGVTYKKIGGVYYKSSDVEADEYGSYVHVKDGAQAYSINGSTTASRFEKDAYNGNGVDGRGIFKNTKAYHLQDTNGEYYVKVNETYDRWIKAGGKTKANSIVDALKSSNGWRPDGSYQYYWKKYAKGTLGTKQDEWALTDESWIGEEITLAAGKHGQLQYLKKGSAVMPADISANLVEWGKLDPSSFTMPGVGSVLNNIVNSVMQPNYEFNFDSLVHVDHCDEGTLKNLEKMVDTKLNDFGRQLNYSIKKFAR